MIGQTISHYRIVEKLGAAMPQEEQTQEQKDEARPKAPVLKGTLKLRPVQVRPVVRAFDAAGNPTSFAGRLVSRRAVEAAPLGN